MKEIWMLCVRADHTIGSWKDKVGMPCVLSDNDWGPSPTWKVCEYENPGDRRTHFTPQVFFTREAAESFRLAPAHPWTSNKERPLGWNNVEPVRFVKGKRQ